MSRSGARMLVAGLAAAWLGAPSRADAYVRTRTVTGTAMCWCVPTNIPLLLLTQTVPKGIDGPLMTHAATEAGAAWSHDAIACSKVKMRILPGDQLEPTVANDSSNRVFFRTDSWAHEIGALAVTSVFAIKQTGRILDTDVEINGVNFTWGDLIADPTSFKANAQDVQNTLTHEFGHVIGLDHPCTLSSNATDAQGRPYVDDKGARVPACSAASTSIQETTMFASVRTGDTDRRTLADDDVRADCAIYPAEGQPQCDCEDATGTSTTVGGCSYAPTATGRAGVGAGLFALLGAAWVRSFARRRARVTSRPR